MKDKNGNDIEPSKTRRLITAIDDEGVGLTAWEINFIADMIDRSPEYLSAKQVAIIERIYDERCP